MAPLVMAALNALGHAIFWFAVAVFDLAIIAYGGPEMVVELIKEIPKRIKAGIQWTRKHPIGFALDFVASAAFTGFWLRAMMTSPSPEPLWLNLLITLTVFMSSLLWWPLMIGWIAAHPIITGFFILVVLRSALSLYLFTMAQWLQTSLILVLLVAGLLLLAPMLLGMFAIMAPVIWGAILAVGYAFRILVEWLGLHGIAKLLESTALVALGLAEYFHFYEIDVQYGQLAYFGAFCGALSVGFTVLSLLSEKTRGWLGDRRRLG